MEKNIPITFFGSGPVAAKSLELLLKNFDIKAVVTKPKPTHHRGDFPVIKIAEKNNLEIFTVSNKNELSDLISTNKIRTDIAILIDFGIIVSKDVIDNFPKGIVNSHFSILPEWRGADPISYSILSGQEKTGVSLMLLVEAMDEGPILGYGMENLNGEEYATDLTDKLIYLSDALLTDIIPSYFYNTVNLDTGSRIIPQSQEQVSMMRGVKFEPTYSRKLSKIDGILDFRKSATQLEREIRAFIEWPKTRTKLAGIDVIITKAEVTDDRGEFGDFKIINGELVIYCKKGALKIKSLKPAGKKEMEAKDFISGYKNRLENY